MSSENKKEILFMGTWKNSQHGDNYFRITLAGEMVDLDYSSLFDAEEDDWTVINVSVPRDRFLEQLRATLATGNGRIDVTGNRIYASQVGMTSEGNGFVRFDIHGGQNGAYHSVPQEDMERMLAALEAA